MAGQQEKQRSSFNVEETQLSAAQNSNAEKKAELYSEVMTRDAKSVQEREQHAKDLALAAASS